jgi:large subunit ribosomal protein L10
MKKYGIECKKLMVEEIKERLKKPSAIFITSFNAMLVPEQEQLRRKLKEIDTSLFLVKNRIAKQAFIQSDKEAVVCLMQGPTALALSNGDSVAISKVLVDFANKNSNFKILGAYIDGQLFDLTLVKKLASIPSRIVLLAQVIGGINSPIQRLLNSLSGSIAKFIIVLDRICNQKKQKSAG